MPIIKSAKKRVKVAARQRITNLRTKRTLRDNIKSLQTLIKEGNVTNASMSEAFSSIDTAVKKNIWTKNKAARIKTQLNSAAKLSGSKTVKAPKKVATPKATAKKATPAKKVTVKKTATKKATK